MVSLGYIIGILYLIVLLLGGEILLKFNKSQNIKFVARKLIHIAISFEWFILYHFFEISYHWIIFTSILTLCLILFHKSFKSISDLENKFNGSLIYCIISVIFSIISYLIPDLFIPFGMSLFALSFGDGSAGLIGYFSKKHNVKLLNDKTLVGTLSAIIFTFIVLFIFNNIFKLNIHILELIIISIMFGFIELITPYNIDNITTSSLTLCLIIIALNSNILIDYAFSLILIPLIGILIIKKKALTFNASIAAILISLGIILTLGDYGFVLLFSFFFFTTVADLIKHKAKKKLLEDMHDKVGSRNVIQVLACGLIPLISGILYIITKNELFIVSFVAAISENLADCLASEIGVLSSKKPIDIIRFKPVEKGLSGGVSLLGFIMSIVGILLITLIYIFTPIYVGYEIIIIISALIGVIMDSILGSLIQRKNICVVCNKITEKNEHCDNQTKHHSGLKWINNSMVNIISNLIVFIVSIALYLLLK